MQPSKTWSNTLSSKQMQISIWLTSQLSWKRCGAFFTRISRWSMGMISRFVKLRLIPIIHSYNSLFFPIKSLRITSYSVPNLYLIDIRMKGLTYDRGVLMVKPGILISLPVPKELTLRPFFYLVITNTTQINFKEIVSLHTTIHITWANRSKGIPIPTHSIHLSIFLPHAPMAPFCRNPLSILFHPCPDSNNSIRHLSIKKNAFSLLFIH